MVCCIPKGFLWFFNAAMNILTDLCVLVLPIPVLSHLRLPRRQKIRVIFIFATGGFACVTSMVRLNYLTRATHTTDYTKDNGPIAVRSQIELNIGILCSCLPPLQPPVTRVFPGLLGSVSHSRGHANKYNGYPNFGFNEPDSGPHSSVSASRSKDRAHRMDAITITQELRLESSDHQYAATGETDSERGLLRMEMGFMVENMSEGQDQDPVEEEEDLLTRCHCGGVSMKISRSRHAYGVCCIVAPPESKGWVPPFHTTRWLALMGPLQRLSPRHRNTPRSLAFRAAGPSLSPDPG
ncbi:hypothetical protein CFD26_107025 [Aspergillus turcosus]|uniref:Rhodopsin domain-containing protein n=1 Tax=Aspergillus turcosus TaxID=1245748 RepID=A0A3R7F859_9EURO|nr:hypothetical protein CFD26_107025 [Aspergillus turcosus]